MHPAQPVQDVFALCRAEPGGLRRLRAGRGMSPSGGRGFAAPAARDVALRGPGAPSLSSKKEMGERKKGQGEFRFSP